MSDLVEFLLARIAEDEAAVTDEAIARINAGTVVGGPGVSAASVDQAQEGLIDMHRVRPWLSPLSPARVLAECEAKRRIIDDMQSWLRFEHVETPERVLVLLALPYADHPDYDESWRP